MYSHQEKQSDNKELNANHELSITSFDIFSNLKAYELLKVEPDHDSPLTTAWLN